MFVHVMHLYTVTLVTYLVYMVYFVHKYRDFLKCTLRRHAVAFQEQREGFAVVPCFQRQAGKPAVNPPQSFVRPEPKRPPNDVQQAALRSLLYTQLRLQLPLLQLTCGVQGGEQYYFLVSSQVNCSYLPMCVSPTLEQEQSGHTSPGLDGRPPAALLLFFQAAAVEVETEPAIISGPEELTQEETLLTHHHPCPCNIIGTRIMSWRQQWTQATNTNC